MVSERYYHPIVPFFNNNLPPPRQFLSDETLLKKKAGKMLIEQVIEFGWRGPRPFGHRRSQEAWGSRPN